MNKKEIIDMVYNLDTIELISKVDNFTETELSTLLTLLTHHYFNSDVDALVSDDCYDILKDKYVDRFGEWEYVGADVDEKLKKKLKFWLGSQDKYKPTDQKKIDNWVKKYPKEVIIEPKFDGVAGFLECEPNKMTLYTRGNGTYGTDISNLIPYLKLPKVTEKLYVRGELIITKKVFEKKFTKDFKNARNLVSGIVNSKKVNIKVAKCINFVAYEIIDKNLSPLQQIEYLQNLKFIVPMYSLLKKIDVDILESELRDFRKKCKYEIDGIVCCHNDTYIRNVSGNPKYSFAFKIPANATRTTVLKIEWNASKHGVLKPRVNVKKVHIQGSDISWVTGFNARYIQENQIGKGTVLDIIKSGDVIPYIQAVVKPTKAELPTTEKYVWNETKIDIILNEENDQVKAKRIVYFFSKLEIKGIGERTSIKFVENGLDTIRKIIDCKIKDFENISFGPVESKNLYNNIQQGIKNVELSKLMSATGIFGFGLGMKKIQLIIDKYGDITKNKLSNQQISDVDGWSEKSAEQFLMYIEKFKTFLKDNKSIVYTIEKAEKKGKYKGMKVVFSGTTGKDLIDKMGATKMSSVSKSTDLLVVMDKNGNSGKIKKAKKLGIKIIEISELNL